MGGRLKTKSLQRRVEEKFVSPSTGAETGKRQEVPKARLGQLKGLENRAEQDARDWGEKTIGEGITERPRMENDK